MDKAVPANNSGMIMNIMYRSTNQSGAVHPFGEAGCSEEKAILDTILMAQSV
jgi:hypothetical protein